MLKNEFSTFTRVLCEFQRETTVNLRLTPKDSKKGTKSARIQQNQWKIEMVREDHSESRVFLDGMR